MSFFLALLATWSGTALAVWLQARAAKEGRVGKSEQDRELNLLW